MDASKKGRSARNKGANGERELSKILNGYGFETKRGQVFNHQSDVIGLPGIHVEAKRVERLNVQVAIEQAENEAAKRQDGIPTLFHRRNNKGWLVTMRLDDWIQMYKAWLKKDG